MARRIVEDPTEDLAEDSTPESFSLEQLSDIIAHNVARGLLHLPAHIAVNARADSSKE